MPYYSQALDLLVAEPRTARAGLEVSSVAVGTRTLDTDAVIAERYWRSADLDATVGPALFLPADLLVAETSSVAVGLDATLGPARFATLDVRTGAVGLVRPVQLDTAVADTQSRAASLEAVTAVTRTFTACLSVPVVGVQEAYACLQVNVEEPGYSRVLTPWLSVAVAETRNACPLPMNVLVSPSRAVRVRLDALVQTVERRWADFSVNICSPDLQIGASAVYNPDGDEVEALLYVSDTDGLHPEWIESMTATLLYRGQHDLGVVTFDCTHATADGDVQAIWMHPAHTDDLTVRFSGSVVNCGDVQFDVAVGLERVASQTFTPQLLEGVDAQPPRVEYTSQEVTTQQLDAAPEEIDVIDQSVVLTLLAVDLVSDGGPIETGVGPVQYVGGGNRLLPSLDQDGSLVYQDANTLPYSIGAYTLVEAGGTNRLTNTSFATPTSQTNAVPQGYEVVSSTSITTLPELVAVGDVNAVKIRAFGSGPYVGPKTLTFRHAASVAVTAGAPVTWSVLARLEYPERRASDIPTEVVRIDTLRLVLSFRDAGGAEISQQVATFNPVDITGDNPVLVQNAAPVPPFGTVAVRVSLDLESIEESDDVNLWLMAPQLEEAASATSRMVGAAPVSRAADTLRLPQAGNLELAQGAVQIDFAVGYPGTPSVDSCLFDTRTGGLDGLALYHMANGRLRFVVADGTGSASLESTAVSFTPGEPHIAVVSWAASLRSIALDGAELVESTDPVDLPGTLGESIYLLSAQDGSARFNGVVTGFEIQREPQG